MLLEDLLLPGLLDEVRDFFLSFFDKSDSFLWGLAVLKKFFGCILYPDSY